MPRLTSESADRKWRQDLSAFQKRSGLVFTHIDLLEQALTHRSWSHERNGADNQRLEFLGDALLEREVSLALFRLFPDEDEGALTRRRANLVCEAALARRAEELGLPVLLRVGQGQSCVTRAMAADALEALAGALFLDGGQTMLERFVEPLVLSDRTAKDPKSRLFEWAASRQVSVEIRLLDKSGPPHAPTFTVQLETAGYSASGQGPNRRAAEQEAAAVLWKRLEIGLVAPSRATGCSDGNDLL